MKRLITLGALLGLGFTANAVTHRSPSFFAPDVTSVQATNGIGVTNLYSALAVGTTNVMGIIYTNAAGQQITTTNANADYHNLLADQVAMFVDQLAQATYPTYTSNILNSGPYFGAIFIRLTGQSGANSAVTFRFRTIPYGGGGGATPIGVEDRVVGDEILISVTAVTTTETHSLTKLDAQKLVGCRGLRLVSITNADTDATSAVTILDCRFVGFVP